MTLQSSGERTEEPKNANPPVVFALINGLIKAILVKIALSF